jgi:hypothetical protein
MVESCNNLTSEAELQYVVKRRRDNAGREPAVFHVQAGAVRLHVPADHILAGPFD